MTSGSDTDPRECHRADRYHIGTECPTRPVCEAEGRPERGFLSLLGAPTLVRYWTYELPDGATVERRIPRFPFSVEEGTIKRLMRGPALYRRASGQPRQEDLLEFLMARKGDSDGQGGAAPEGRRTSLEPLEVA